MRKTYLFFTMLCLTLSSCSYHQFSAVATGSSLGGMFGSSIGGLIGGYRGHEIGTVAGMTAGAAIGLAATAEKNTSQSQYEEDVADDYIEYEEYEPRTLSKSKNHNESFNALDIESIRFADSNNNHYLEPGEHASLVMNVYNRGDYTLYNIAPQIVCDNKRIDISPTAIVGELAPGKGFHYRAEVIASERLKEGETIFKINFVDGKQKVQKKIFRIRTRR